MARLLVFLLFAAWLTVAQYGSVNGHIFSCLTDLLSRNEKINCTDMEQRTRFLEGLNQAAASSTKGDFEKFKDDHFRPYLQECGLDEGFKEVMNENSEISYADSDSPVTEYLLTFKAKSSDETLVENQLGALKFLEKMMSMSPFDQSNCNQKYVQGFAEHIYSNEDLFHDLQVCLDKRLPGFLKACENNVKLMGERFKEQQPHEWDRIETLTGYLNEQLHMADRQALDRVQQMVGSVVAFERLRFVSDDLAAWDLRKSFEKPCRAYMQHMSPSLTAVELVSASKDKEMMNFMVPFDYCALVLYAEANNHRLNDDWQKMREQFGPLSRRLVSCRRELRDLFPERRQTKYEFHELNEYFKIY